MDFLLTLEDDPMARDDEFWPELLSGAALAKAPEK